MQGMRSNISFPNGIRAKSRKFVGPGCSPAKSSILRNTQKNFFASTLLAFHIFVAPPCFFFSIKLCEILANFLITFSKQMKVFFMNRTFPVFSLFVHSFWAIAWENVETISLQISIFSVIWLRMIRLKYNSFYTDMGIQVM